MSQKNRLHVPGFGLTETHPEQDKLFVLCAGLCCVGLIA